MYTHDAVISTEWNETFPPFRDHGQSVVREQNQRMWWRTETNIPLQKKVYSVHTPTVTNIHTTVGKHWNITTKLLLYYDFLFLRCVNKFLAWFVTQRAPPPLPHFSFDLWSVWNHCSHKISLRLTCLNVCMYLKKTVYDISWLKLSCKTCKMWIVFAILVCFLQAMS